MKVLLIANYRQNSGGISGQVRLLFENLINEGEDVAVFSTIGNPLKRLYLFLKLFIVGIKYDVFHVHACSRWGILPAVMGVIVGKCLRKKVILTYHGGGADAFFSRYTRLVKWICLNTDYNIVLSGFLARIFDKYMFPYVELPNIIEVKSDIYRPKKIIRPYFISVRSLEPLYNILCIIKAFSIVKESLPDAELHILADGSEKANLEQYVKENQIVDVTFHGRVHNQEIDNYLMKADVFVSSPKIDNQPMSILEAFRAGLLVISSNVGGVPYLVENGVTGRLFPNDDHEELAKIMIDVIRNPEESLEMIDKAHSELDKYTWMSIKPKLFSLYNG